MTINCPGSKRLKQPHPEMIRCPKCSTEIEIWSDEFEVTCPGCKRVLIREREGNPVLNGVARQGSVLGRIDIEGISNIKIKEGRVRRGKRGRADVSI